MPSDVKFKRYTKDPQGSRSLQHSIYDGMATSIMVGAGETYFSAFALFLKVSTAQVGLLSTLPPLLGSFAQIISVFINRRIKHCKPVVLAGVITQACLWMPLLWLVLHPPVDPLLPLLLLLTLYYGAAHLAAPTWTRMIGDIVPERRRGRFFAQRNRFNSIMTLFALIIAGLILETFDKANLTWAGFTSIFIIAFFARLISAWHISRMHEPIVHDTILEKPGIVLNTLLHSGALWFTLYFVLMQTVVAIASPFFAVYMLEDLSFSYLEFTICTGTVVLVQFTTLKLWGKTGDVYGHRVLLLIGGLLIPFLPMFWLISDNFWYLVVLQVFSGLAWGGFSLACGNLLYELVPPAQRVSYIAVHNVLVAIGVFLGGLVGIILITILPVRSTWLGDQSIASSLLNLFMISALLRMIVTALFLGRIKEKRKRLRPGRRHQFIFRVSRFNAFMGLLYDFVTESRPDKPGQN